MPLFTTTVSFLLVLGLLLFDSFGFYAKSIKYLFIDSRFILILFLTVSTFTAFFDCFSISPVISKLNKLVFPLLFIGTIVMVLGNFYWYTTFSLNIFYIDVRNFMFVTLLSGFMVYLEYAQTLKKKDILDKIQYLGPPFVLIVLFFVERYMGNLFYILDREDGVFETLQFISYLFSGILSFSVAYKLYCRKLKPHAILFALLGVMLLFIAGEEVSWGQRFFNVPTPASIVQNNLQGEITIHNNRSVQFKTYYLYMIIGLYGSLGWVVLKFLSKKLQKSLALFVPPPQLFLYFFASFAFFFFSWYMSTYYGLFDARITSFDPWQELAELYVSLGFLQFMVGRFIFIKTKLTKR